MDYIPPELDESSKQAIDAINKRVLDQSAGSIANANLEKVDDAGGLLNAPPMARQGFDPEGAAPMLKAIQQKTQNKFQSDLQRLKSQTRARAERDILERRAKAVNLLSKEQAYNEQVRAAKAAAEQQRKRARASTLGTILGVAGAVIGGVASGGAAAGAGYLVGSGLGNSIGGGGE